MVHRDFRDVKDATFALPPQVQRDHGVAEAVARHDTAVLDGAQIQKRVAKRARGEKVLGSVTGRAARQRLDHPNRRKRRADGGLISGISVPPVPPSWRPSLPINAATARNVLVPTVAPLPGSLSIPAGPPPARRPLPTRADGGALGQTEPPPGADRSNYQEGGLRKRGSRISRRRSRAGQ